MDSKKASALIDKYVAGKCTQEERNALFAHFNTFLDKSHKTLSSDETNQLSLDTWEAINKQIHTQRHSSYRRTIWRRWLPSMAAAAILLTGGWLFLQNITLDKKNTTTGIEHDIVPLGDKAILTVDNSHTIELNAAQTGLDFSKTAITYQDGSSLYLQGETEKHTYRLSTPKGATYQVTLPDGTKVWLNGGSEIKYPGKFDTEKRQVELEGEAYFSVVKQAGSNFIVTTKGQEIKVLGTEFNVSTYNSNAIKTTLIEGSVQITASAKTSPSLVLSPGDQSIVHPDGTSNKYKANLKKELAWRSGVFYFEQTPFSEILQQVSQWYDIEVQYISKVPQGTFSGIIDRHVSLLTLLEYFEESSHHKFKLENNILKVKA